MIVGIAKKMHGFQIFKPGMHWPQAGTHGFLKLLLVRSQYECLYACVCAPGPQGY